MSVVYSPRAVRDLEQIGAYYRSVADAGIAAALGERIEAVIVRLEQHPLSAPQVTGRPGVRVVPVLRYPYKVF